MQCSLAFMQCSLGLMHKAGSLAENCMCIFYVGYGISSFWYTVCAAIDKSESGPVLLRHTCVLCSDDPQ